MRNRRNFYRLLQVQPDAPFEVIRASYRTILRELKQHPDLGGDHWNAKLLNEAYNTLSDTTRRAAYDRTLFEYYTKNPFQSENGGKQPLISIFCPFCKRPFARKESSQQQCPSCKSPLKSSGAVKPNPSCRRSTNRVKKSGKIRFYTDWPQKGLSADIVDLSRHGLRFRAPQKIRAEAIIKISSPLLSATAKVKNSRKIYFKIGSVIYETGVIFIAVSFREKKGAFYSASA